MKNVTKIMQVLMVFVLLAFASQTIAQTTLLTEGWESAVAGSTTPPAGWGMDVVAGSNITYYQTSGTWPTVAPYEGARLVEFQSFNYSTATNRLKRTTAISTVGYGNVTVDFAWYTDNGYAGTTTEGVTVQWSTNGTTWTSSNFYMRYSATNQWVIENCPLPAGASNQATLYVAFYFNSNFGDNCHMDIMHVKGSPLGNLTGTVKNCYNNALLSGASVSCGGVGPVLTNGAGVYTINGISAGAQTVTATMAGYSSYGPAPVTIIGNQTVTSNFCLNPIPATLAGMITDCANNAPIIGAKLTVTTTPATIGYSVIGGQYSLSIFPGGTYSVTIHKAGFMDTTVNNVVLTSAVTTTLNMCLRESINTPNQPFTAALNSGNTAVNLNWGVPTGQYELLYDDGKQDTNTVWASANNLNAVRMTPVAYPVSAVGGSVDIGESYSYPNGTTVASLTPFTMQVYDATGTGGAPGTALGAAVTVTPTTFGWNSFNITGVNITSGNFWLVMKQAGVPPAAARLAVDTSSTQLRSWQKYGTGPWLPASGNFMIRAIANGPGGPPENPVAVTGYQVYRLFGQDTGNPANWIPVSAPTANNTVDPSWPSLPDSAYIWAVKAHYGGTRWSNSIFSNYLGKNRNAAVTVNVMLTCAATPLAGTTVTLTSLAPFTSWFVYTATTDATGKATFTGVQKAPYQLKVTRSGYDMTTMNVSIYGDRIYNITALQTKYPASKAVIDGKSLFMHWTPPGPHIFAMNEDFSGGFAPNAWVNPTGYWQIMTTGNPGNCAEYSWLHFQTGYSTTLTSKSITGMGAPDFKLYWDIFLSDFAGDGNEQLDVEIQVGGAGAWTSLKHYANTGNLSWQTDSASLTAYTNNTFKIRFNAHGADSFNINNWDIDNVKVVSNIPDPKPCILAYNVYLNGIMDGTAMDTVYTVPGNHVVYGTTYTACVKVVYGSGTSAPACTAPFVSRWLCPPTNFAGQAIEATAYLTWTKPSCGCTLGNLIYDSGVMGNGLSINPGFNIQMGDYFPLAGTAAGTITGFDIMFTSANGSASHATSVYVYGPGPAHALLGVSDQFINGPASGWPAGSWVHVTCTPGIAYTGPFYALVDYNQTVLINYMGLDVTTATYDPQGLAWANYAGAWAYATTTFALAAPETFIIRAVSCISSTDKAGEMTVIDPTTISNSAPVPAAANYASATNISEPTGNPPLPMAPAAAPTLLGYNITRDGSALPYIGNPNTLSYYDNNLNPGTYHYCITSYWDVTPIQPLHDNSAPVCGVTVTINYGRPLPFCETWDAGTLAFNNWTAVGNWSCNTGFGNPAPAADFSWQPSLNNYNDTLQSATFSAGPYSCAKIYLEYDYKLLDRNHTGAEYLTVEELKNGAWTKVDEYANNGDVAWTHKKFELKQTVGTAFKVRFRAHGAHSLDILHWYVDNICMYAVCNRPLTLTYTESHNTVNLSWLVPTCKASGPPAHWIHWDDGVNFLSIGTGGAADFDIAGYWTSSQIASLSGGSITKISFYPNSAGAAAFRARVYTGDPSGTPTLVCDQAVPTVTYDQWNTVVLNTPVLIDVSKGLMIAMNVNATSGWPAGCDAGPAIDGSGDMMLWQGAWVTLISLNPSLDYNWNVQGYVETVKGATEPIVLTQPIQPMSSGSISASGHIASSTNAIFNKGGNEAQGASILMGYNVYRTDSTANMSTSHKINSNLVTGLTYTDLIPLVGWGTYKYNVTAVMNDSITNTFLCESPNSDTVTVQFPHVGITEIGNGQIMVYPNPATDNVNVKSDFTVTSIEVMNYTGQTVYRNTTVNSKTTQFNVSTLQAGIYFVKVATDQGARTLKITVTR